jgi:hypothetical protein
LQQNKQHLPCNFPMKNVSPDEWDCLFVWGV